MKKILLILCFICLNLTSNAQEQDIKVPIETLKTYVGKYELSPNAIMDISLNERKMFAQLTGQSKVEIYASSNTEFFLKVIEAKIKFQVDDKGNVLSLTLHQNGREITGKKI